MTEASEKLAAKLIVDLAPFFRDRPEPIAVGIGFDGAVYAAARDSNEDLRIKQSSGAIFWKSRLERPTDYLIIRWKDGDIRKTTLRDSMLVASFIQPVPEGILLAGSRCRWKEVPELYRERTRFR